MNFPENYLYTQSHEWVKIDGQVATIGISEYAAHELGEIAYVDVKTVGETLDKGEAFGTLETVKSSEDIYLPVSGEVIEFNADLEDHPELINQDCYEKGWIVKVNMSNPEEKADLLDARAYEATLAH